MSSQQIFSRWNTILSTASVSVTSTPVKVSGATSGNLLTLAALGFAPSNFRVGIILANSGSDAAYLSRDSAGTDVVMTIDPYSTNIPTFFPANGTMQLYLGCAGSDTTTVIISEVM